MKGIGVCIVKLVLKIIAFSYTFWKDFPYYQKVKNPYLKERNTQEPDRHKCLI